MSARWIRFSPIMKKIGILPCVAKIDIDTIERLAQEYSQIVSDLGFLPFILPHTENNFQAFVNELDGFVLTGSACDISPELYQQDNTHSKECNLKVDKQELAFLSIIAQSKKPLLGICRGMQFMNIFEGGTLKQDIPASAINHYGYKKQASKVHSMEVLGSKYLKNGIYKINSIHHQAIDEIGDNLKVTGTAPDGIIEMIEHEKLPWLGVQWHPEFELPNPGFKEIYDVLNH